MTRIQREYEPGETAKVVQKWEQLVDNAPSDSAAQTQLLYLALLQLRTIKVILAAALLVIPVMITVGIVIMVSSSGQSPYP